MLIGHSKPGSESSSVSEFSIRAVSYSDEHLYNGVPPRLVVHLHGCWLLWALLGDLAPRLPSVHPVNCPVQTSTTSVAARAGAEARASYHSALNWGHSMAGKATLM